MGIMKPFSDNIVFVDTEFSDLDPYTGEILSIALVKLSGDSLYLELEYDGDVHPWVKDNILPTLMLPKVSREDAKTQIVEFVGEDRPFLVAFVPQYDMVYLIKLFGVGNVPFHMMAIDFASMLFAEGIDPDRMREANSIQFLRDLGLNPDNYRRHFALDDARMLKDTYLEMTKG